MWKIGGSFMPRSSTAPKKQVRDPEKTRQRLLKSATKLFARHGFDGVAVDDIVKAAGVNKRMVYHYFGNKEGLYAEALKQVFSRLADLELKSLEDVSDPVRAIRNILEAYFKFLGDNSDFVALLSWENLHHGRFLAVNPGILSKSPVLRRLEEVLREGTARGVFRTGVNEKHLLITLISICFVYHANRYTLSQSVGLDLRSPQVLEEGLEHAITMVLHGLLEPGQ